MGQLSDVHQKLLLLRLGVRAILAGSRRVPEPPDLAGRHRAESLQLKAATLSLWNALDALHGKANFDPNQPRVPRGSPGGGQWTDAGGGSRGPGASTQTGRTSSETTPSSDQSTLRVTITAKPTEQERHIEGVTDEGDPRIWPEILLAGLPSGHHYGPQTFLRSLGLPPETMKVFADAKTGPLLGPPHGWSKPHRIYNDAIREEFWKFVKEFNIDVRKMTPDQAREFLRRILNSERPEIRDFNRRIWINQIVRLLRQRNR